MASFSAIRDGLKTNIQTISATLEVYDTVPGQIVVPCAVIGVPKEIVYDLAIGRGADRWIIPVRVHVQLSDYATAQDDLDAYLDSKSGSSIKTAVESDKTLSGVAASVRVTDMDEYGEYTYGNTVYLGAGWLVEVITQ